MFSDTFLNGNQALSRNKTQNCNAEGRAKCHSCPSYGIKTRSAREAEKTAVRLLR